jgi:hypothetical protein
MSAPAVPTVPRPSVSPAVLAFAREQGVEQYLSPLIEWARQVYPTASRFEVFTEDDPEIANDTHIVFELDVPLDLEQALQADRRWHDGLFRIVPAPLVCVFRKSADPRPEGNDHENPDRFYRAQPDHFGGGVGLRTGAGG